MINSAYKRPDGRTLNDHLDDLENTIRGFRGFVSLLSAAHEADFHCKADDLYWLLNGLLLDFEHHLDEMREGVKDPENEVFQSKWEAEKSALQERQWAESRELHRRNNPDMPRAAQYRSGGDDIVQEVEDILEKAHALNVSKGATL